MSSPMRPLGHVRRFKFYWAGKGFIRRGIHVWSGKRHYRVLPLNLAKKPEEE